MEEVFIRGDDQGRRFVVGMEGAVDGVVLAVGFEFEALASAKRTRETSRLMRVTVSSGSRAIFTPPLFNYPLRTLSTLYIDIIIQSTWIFLSNLFGTAGDNHG